MSEIKALEKLRECAEHSSEGWFVNLEQAFGLRRYKCGDSTVKPDGGAILNAIADSVQAEVDERFMELPLDADDVPIRVGDTVEWLVKNGDYEVVAVGELVALKLGEDGSFTIAADALRHVKPRTLEDVLCDFANDVAKQGHQIGLTAHELSDKYAAEIRELLGVVE